MTSNIFGSAAFRSQTMGHEAHARITTVQHSNPSIGFQYDHDQWEFRATTDSNGRADVIIIDAMNNGSQFCLPEGEQCTPLFYDPERYFVIKVRNAAGDVSAVQIYEKHKYHWYEINSRDVLTDGDGNRVKDPYHELPSDQNSTRNFNAPLEGENTASEDSKPTSEPSAREENGLPANTRDSRASVMQRLQDVKSGLAIGSVGITFLGAITGIVGSIVLESEEARFREEERLLDAIRNLARANGQAAAAVPARPIPVPPRLMNGVVPPVGNHTNMLFQNLQRLNHGGANQALNNAVQLMIPAAPLPQNQLAHAAVGLAGNLQLNAAPKQHVQVQAPQMQIPATQIQVDQVLVPLNPFEKVFANKITATFNKVLHDISKLALSSNDKQQLQKIQLPLENLSSNELLATSKLLICAIKTSYKGSGRSQKKMQEKAKEIKLDLEQIVRK